MTLDREVVKEIHRQRRVYTYIRSLPRHIRFLFIPTSIPRVRALEIDLAMLHRWEQDRDSSIRMQLKYKLPLKANEGLRHTYVRINVQRIRDRKNRGPDLPTDDGEGIK